MVSRNNLWNLASIGAVAAVVYSGLSFLVPYQIDDLWYIDLADRFDGNYLHTACAHWLEQNGRLGNLLCPLLLGVLPKWLFSMLIGICVGGLLVQSARLGYPGEGRLYVGRVLSFWLVFAIVLPWHDNIMVADFALNYILSAWLNITFLIVFFGRGRIGWVWLVCAIAAGWSHEGVSVPLFCSIFLLLAVKRNCFKRRNWLLIGCYAVGMAIAVSSPGLWSRVAQDNPLAGPVSIRTMIRAAVFWFPAASGMFIAFCICAVVRRWRRYVVKAISDSVSLTGLLAVGLTYLIVVYTGASFRGAFMAELLCVVIVFRVFVERVNWRMGVVCGVLLAAFYSGVLWWQYKLCRQNELVEQMLSPRGGEIFIPLIEYAPWYTLGHTTDAQWRTPLHYYLLNEKYESQSPIVVLPETLNGFNGATDGTALDGDAGAVLYGDLVLVPESDVLAEKSARQGFGERYLYCGFRVQGQNGGEYGIDSSLRGIKGTDGRVWYLLSPDRAYWRDRYRKVDFSL